MALAKPSQGSVVESLCQEERKKAGGHCSLVGHMLGTQKVLSSVPWRLRASLGRAKGDRNLKHRSQSALIILS